MSHDPTRKHFLAKVLGLVAVAGLAPKLLTKPAAPVTPAPAALPVVSILPENRAVSRRAGTA